MQSHIDTDLQNIFNQCFENAFQTILVGGAQEPIYIPKQHPDSHLLVKDELSLKVQNKHVIFYRSDYFRSALHEVAHWCIAGQQRRNLVDFGYWYTPDGRSNTQQMAFQQVEVKPQALEYAFCLAAKVDFRVSVDNLSTEDGLSESEIAKQELDFFADVTAQLNQFISQGFPMRAQLFINALLAYYQCDNTLITTKLVECIE